MSARALALALSLALVGCARPTPTPTPVPTATPTPTLTPTATSIPTPTATPTPTFPADAVVDAEALNLRAGPDTLHPVVGSVRQATPLALRGRNLDGSWFAVRAPDDSQGWVNAGFVTLRRDYDSVPPIPTPSPPAPPTPTPAPMDPALPLVLAPPAVAAGDPFLVRLRAPGASQVVAAIGDRTAALFPVGGDAFAGLVAVGPDAAPGQVVVHVTALDAAGEPTALEAPLAVRPPGFPNEEIDLDEATTALLDPALREAENLRLAEIWSVVSPERLWEGTWARPVTGTISSAFGTRRSYNQGAIHGYHSGVDFRGRNGTPVIAPARGRVALAETLRARGNTVWLDHGWGVYSGYFHLSGIDVALGQVVERGAHLGRIGATGMVTGPHLHWEVRVGGVDVQPLEWLRRDVGALP